MFKMEISTNTIDVDFLTPRYCLIYGEFKDTIRNMGTAPIFVYHIFSGNSKDKCTVFGNIISFLGLQACPHRKRTTCMSLCLSVSLSHTHTHISSHQKTLDQDDSIIYKIQQFSVEIPPCSDSLIQVITQVKQCFYMVSQKDE